MGGYNTETFYIEPKKDRIVTQRKDSYYLAFNVGKTNVTIAIIQGNAFAWTNTISSNPITPGMLCLMQIGQRNGYIGVKVINQGDLNAFVHVFGGNNQYDEWDSESKPYFNLDLNNLAKTIVTFGAGYVPVIGSVLSTTIGFFWPAASEPSVWDQIKDQVLKEVNSKAQDTIKGIMNGKLEYIKERIKTCAREVDDERLTKTIASHYMNIAEDLVGFEKQFTFNKGSNSDYVKVNYILLPMWATLVNLKMTFYQYGIVNQKKVGLDDEHLIRLKDYCKRVVHDPEGANAYVSQVYKDMMADEYKHSYAETLYDQLATVRAYCSLNGFQNLIVWKAIAKDPTNTKKPHNPAVVFSTQYGRNNAVQHRRQVTDTIPPPLQPKEISGKLNLPQKVDIFISSKDSPKIGGLKVTYVNGETATTGKKTSGDTVAVDFKEKNLVKLTVHGTGQINAFVFTFDDGSSQSVGTKEGNTKEFALDKHRIVGFFMTGSRLIKDQNISGNVAVSYQLITED